METNIIFGRNNHGTITTGVSQAPTLAATHEATSEHCLERIERIAVKKKQKKAALQLRKV